MSGLICDQYGGTIKLGLLFSLACPNLRVPSDDRNLPKRIKRGTIEFFTIHSHQRTQLTDNKYFQVYK